MNASLEQPGPAPAWERVQPPHWARRRQKEPHDRTVHRILPGHCNLCGCVLDLKQDPDCPPEWAQVLARMVRCNRCADFARAQDNLWESLCQTCVALGRAEPSVDPEEEKAKRLASYQWLTEHTQKYAKLLQQHLRLRTNLWSPHFPAALLRNPAAWRDILNDFLEAACALRTEPRSASSVPPRPARPEGGGGAHGVTRPTSEAGAAGTSPSPLDGERAGVGGEDRDQSQPRLIGALIPKALNLSN